jgi:hypothetical protein
MLPGWPKEYGSVVCTQATLNSALKIAVISKNGSGGAEMRLGTSGKPKPW